MEVPAKEHLFNWKFLLPWKILSPLYVSVEEKGSTYSDSDRFQNKSSLGFAQKNTRYEKKMWSLVIDNHNFVSRDRFAQLQLPKYFSGMIFVT